MQYHFEGYFVGNVDGGLSFQQRLSEKEFIKMYRNMIRYKMQGKRVDE